MLFLQLFKTLKGKYVEVRLCNDILMRGILQSVDNFYNIKLVSVDVLHSAECIESSALSSAYIRGSQVSYISLPRESVDLNALHDAIRKNEQ